ncbi:hypothetical protein N7G274_000176 [Stereocaulon virgatum]|uniref:Uncharacterized protein n=1 Tax=Stereocaulon virgatum TaxID=373712 RepID=A0ABR4AS37_9LECA
MKRKREFDQVGIRGPSNLVVARETPNDSILDMDTFEYAEFDRENNIIDYDGEHTDEELDDDNDVDGSQSVYSDFNMLDSSDSAAEFCDASYSFDSLNAGYQYAVDPGGKAIDLVMENERHDEVSIAPAGSGFSRRFFPNAVRGF